MRNLLKYIIVALIVIVAVSCEVLDHDLPIDPQPKPTKPIKRRPTYPTDKIKRPRVDEGHLKGSELEIVTRSSLEVEYVEAYEEYDENEE